MTDAMDLAQQIYLIVDELRGVATMSDLYAKDVYDKERAEQITRAAARLAELIDTGLIDTGSVEALTELFDEEAWRRISPAVGVEAVVVDGDGRVLLCQRRDNQNWCLPGGVAEIGQSTSDAALRELWEEAGLRGRVSRLLGAFDGPAWGTRSKTHFVHLVYAVECDDLVAVPGSEMLATQFFNPDKLPDQLHPGHAERIPVALQHLQTGGAHYDDATSNGVEMPMHQRPGHD